MAADHLERSGYRVSEVEVPDINGVWQTWCDIITNETAVLQEAAMLKVTATSSAATDATACKTKATPRKPTKSAAT